MTARAYARRLSVSDMNALSDLYETDVGRRFVSVLPALTAEAGTTGRTSGEQILAPRIAARLRELERQGKLQSP
jgi:hypothetical protein